MFKDCWVISETVLETFPVISYHYHRLVCTDFSPSSHARGLSTTRLYSRGHRTPPWRHPKSTDILFMQPIWAIAVCWSVGMMQIHCAMPCLYPCSSAALHVDLMCYCQMNPTSKNSPRMTNPSSSASRSYKRGWRAICTEVPIWRASWWEWNG
jgi:hypothetical protein